MSVADEMTRPDVVRVSANRAHLEPAERDVSVFCVHLVWFFLTLLILAFSFTLFFAPMLLWHHSLVLGPIILVCGACVLTWLRRQHRRLGPCATKMFSASATSTQLDDGRQRPAPVALRARCGATSCAGARQAE